MVQINFARREVGCKIVYYGPGLSGKTTNLEKIHQKAPQQSKGNLTSIATEGDRTLFFDFLPLDLGEIAGMRTKFQLYTVPGQVFYNSTRKLVLQGADGVIFVADSDPTRMADNIESLKNLQENLTEHGSDIKTIPLIYQFNKRDLPTAMPFAEMKQQLNLDDVKIVEAVAFKGEGVMQTLKELAKKVVDRLNESVAAPSGTHAGSVLKPAEVPRHEPVHTPVVPSKPVSLPQPEPAPVMASRDAAVGGAPEKSMSAAPPSTKPAAAFGSFAPPRGPEPSAPPERPKWAPVVPSPVYRKTEEPKKPNRLVWLVAGAIAAAVIVAAFLLLK